ncbi:MAG: hypothetical protein RL218_698 [Actinomycetota bacterium]
MNRCIRADELQHEHHPASRTVIVRSCSTGIHQQITSSIISVGRVVTVGPYFCHVTVLEHRETPVALERSTPQDVRRVVIAAESFLPHMNGVTNSVLRAVEHLTARGYEVSVLAPGPGKTLLESVEVHRTRAIGMPGYKDVRLTIPSASIADFLVDQRPDVVHVAAPFVLGSMVLRQCRRLGIPTVAIYQTDVAGFARDYRLGKLAAAAWRIVAHIHGLADLTLAPSTAAIADLERHGVQNVQLWARGVNSEKFNPAHRNEVLRRMFDGHQRMIVGYVGRLAREKRIDLLAPLANDPRFSVVIVGDGPCRSALKKLMPKAYFMGFAEGQALSELYASFDVFVHAGLSETFCQSIQEALASGVPVVAPASGGPLDLVEAGVNGLFWNPERPESLVEMVELLKVNPELHGMLAANARQSVVARTWSSIMGQLEDHYHQVVEKVSGDRFRGAA